MKIIYSDKHAGHDPQTFFVRGVEVCSELRVSLRRLAAFLAIPDPPEPREASADGQVGGAEERG